ncbi:12877_t:CDS:10 [Entrophospora sp. SA101]|nr:12877_t:CDS:10 [Entrophospora sp. SA101]
MAAEFGWSFTTQGLVLSSFLVGYLLTQVIGGILADKFGGKMVLGISAACWNLFTLLTPISAKFGLNYLILCRICLGVGEGAAFPCIHSMIASWIPKQENSRAATIITVSAYSASFFALPLSTWLGSGPFGWPSIFWVFGFMGIIWSILWHFYGGSNPSDYPGISQEELKLILDNSNKETDNVNIVYTLNEEQETGSHRNLLKDLSAPEKFKIKRIPWKIIFSRREVWAIILATFFNSFGFFIMVTWLPTYYLDRFGIDINKLGYFAVLPDIIQAIMGLIAGIVGDFMIHRMNFRIRTVRRIAQSIGGFATNPIEGLIVIGVGLGLRTFVLIGSSISQFDILPKYAGFIYAIGNTAGILAGIIGVFINGWLLDVTGNQWAYGYNIIMRCPTPIPEIQEKEPLPKISEGSISLNGVSSLVEIERSFNQLRIPELELPTTPEATIKVALSELYQLQEDLQIHLQGGPLADPSTLGIQRRRKVTDLLERVMKDIALYEEFDTLSDISYKSTTSTTASNIPMSPRISKSYYDSNVSKLRTMSSASLASAKSKASSHFSRSSSPSMLFNEDAAFSTPPEPWDAFRWKPMDKISDHLYSQNVSQSAGLPTVLAVSGVIAIGTTRGLVLVYENPQEILKCILGSTSNAIEYGAVTSLAISSDHSQILSGHSQGYILIWDINKPISPIRTILPISSGAVAGGKKEGHIHGSAILHVGFVGVRKNGIVSGDNHGLAFFHNLYKVMLFNATETTRIIGRYPISSSHNEFHVGSKIKRPSTIFGLAPLPFGQLPHGSEGFGLVAILTPYKVYLKPKNISTDSSTASKSISGCLAWYPAVKFQLNTVIQPEHPKSKRKPDFVLEFIKVGQWKARNKDIVVFDPRYMQESEQNNIRHRSLVYHNHFSSLLIDRSDDSIKNTVDLAYYHSLRIYKSHGVRNLYVGSLLSWADRILAFVQSGDYLEAIALATSYYNGTTSQTILGLPDNEEIRHMIVGGKLMELLNASINYAFSSERTFAGMADEHNVLFHDLAVACIQACLSMHKEEFLFNDIYERYSNASAKGTLLEVLEPYILDDKMEELPPEIMKDLVTHYRDCRLLTRIEQCIWHINPKYLDIDQVVQLCKNEKLYDALIYVWNRSMDDYVNPAVELLGLIKKVLSLEKRKKKEHRFNGITDHVDSMEEDDLEVLKADARKFYTYMENILTGHTYPNGAPLNEKDANEARTNLYSFIFSGRCIIWPKNGGELILTAEDEAEGREPIYPYLRLFLRFNTKAFLQALEIAFEDSYLNGTIINKHSNRKFSQSDISQLYCFVAKNLPKYPQFLLLPRNAMQKILAALSLDTDPHTREERQLSVECLLSIYTPQDEDQMVRLYESAGFWRVLENVYKAEQKYGLLLSTYLKDPERRNEVFDCIRELLNPKSHITETQRQEVSQIIMEKIEEIVDIDGGLTAFIVQAFFSGDHKTIISNLSSSPARLFTYLRVLLEPSEDVSKNNEIKFVKTVEEQLIWLETSNSISEPEIHEKYITLMCKFDPTGVYHYLKTHQGAYRLEKILPACISAGIVDSVVWIMEQSGNAVGALDKILEILLDTFLDATKAITSSVTPQRPPRLSEKLLSNNTYEAPKSPIPTHIADLLITTFKSYVQSILRSLLLSTSSPYVSLPRLLLKFIRSQSRRNSTVADFRDIFIGMIDTYKYESQLLTLTNRLFEKDLFMGVASVVKQRGKGWRPRRGTCEVCGGHFWGTDISLLNHQTKTTVNPKKEQSKTSTIYDSDEIIGIEVLQGISDQVLTEEEINRYLQILTEEKINTPLQMQTQPQTQSSPPEAALSEIACLNSESERRNSSVSFEIKNQSTENSSFKPFKGKNRLVS